MTKLGDEFSTARKAIMAAGEAVMSRYGRLDRARLKSASNPVTEADLVSQRIILEHLSVFDDGILAEETARTNRRLSQKRVWVIDPLDGTKDFLQQTGEFTIMIGLVEDHEPVFGLVYRPAADVLYFARKGKGAFKTSGGGGEEKLRVSRVADLTRATLLVSRNHRLSLEDRLAREMKISRVVPCGSAGLKICLIAEGGADLYLNTSGRTWEWDVMAADVILAEAGGRLSDLAGRAMTYNRPDPRNCDGFVASNGLIHRHLPFPLTPLRSDPERPNLYPACAGRPSGKGRER
jgi:3'(2'), 5'-bisphosphate nucleotidase